MKLSLLALTFAILSAYASPLTGSPLAAFPSTDCHACRTTTPSGFFCNQNNQLGYCCPPGGSSFYGCQESAKVNRTCSKAADPWYYQACFWVNRDRRCGGMANTTIRLDEVEDRTKVRSISVANLPVEEKTACAWQFVDRLDGLYRKFNGDRLQVRVDAVANMDVIIAIGVEEPSQIVKNSTTLKVGEWVEYNIKDRVFLAVTPKAASNSLKVSYRIALWT